MQLVPEDFVYDLTDDLEPGWQPMEILKYWTKEISIKDSPSAVTYLYVEFGSVDNEKTETIKWSGPYQPKGGTRTKLGKLLRDLFPGRRQVSFSELDGKQCEANLQENEKGFLEVAGVRPIEEHTQTKKQSK